MSIEVKRDARLGGVAYEAYCQSLERNSVGYEPPPQWNDLSDELKIAWCDAAYEVSREAVQSWLSRGLNFE